MSNDPNKLRDSGNDTKSDQLPEPDKYQENEQTPVDHVERGFASSQYLDENDVLLQVDSVSDTIRAQGGQRRNDSFGDTFAAKPSVLDVFQSLKQDSTAVDGSIASGIDSVRPRSDTVTSTNSTTNNNYSDKKDTFGYNDVKSVAKGTTNNDNHHKRRISWGVNEVVLDNGRPTRITRDVSAPTQRTPYEVRRQAKTEDFGLLQGWPDRDRPMPPVYIRRHKESDYNDSKRRLDIEHITQRSPIETEAETYIMRSLEERDPTRPRTYSEPTSSVLPDLSDDAADIFIPTVVEGGESVHISNSPSDEDDRPRGPETNRPTMLDGRGGVSTRSFRNRGRHKRSVTMEQTLFGLTTAIDALQAHHWDQVIASDDENEVLMPSINKDNTSRLDIPQSSAEVLGNNANKLCRRHKPNQKSNMSASTAAAAFTAIDDDNNSLSTHGTAARRWRTLKTALKTVKDTKKTDEDIIEAAFDEERLDEELGSVYNAVGNTGGNDNPLPENASTQGKGSKKDDNEGQSVASLPQAQRIKDEWKFFKEFQSFFDPHRSTYRLYFKLIVCYTMIPLLGISFILFYFADNTPTGVLANNGRPVNGTLYNTRGDIVPPNKASASWWCLFVVRQLFTGCLAKLTELFFIEFMSEKTRITITMCGPWLSLLIMQSRGWPFILTAWSILNYALLSGGAPFFSHWLFWQDRIDLFNNRNPSGSIVNTELYTRLLAVSIAVGVVVSLKRFWLGLYLGRQTFSQYSEKLASIMNKIILISQVSSLARDFERLALNNKSRNLFGQNRSFVVFGQDKLGNIIDDFDNDSASGSVSASFQSMSKKSVGLDANDADRVIDPDDRNPMTGSLSLQQKAKLSQLLGAWEEPSMSNRAGDRISVSALLQFKRALTCLHTQFPFSGHFGLADTRENCVEGSQDVYDRLMLHTPDENHLNFETLALLGIKKNGSIDQGKIKELIRLFRPDRDGKLKMVDFVKSIDSVYKEIRLLRASVLNSSKIDHAFETIFNCGFYVIILSTILGVLGINPITIYSSIGTAVVGFVFIVGAATSKYFEGVLFIIARRPYQIGDGIHVSNVETDTKYTGSPWWTVEDVNLFYTSVVFLFTGERATISNGSLANSRIINATRSPQAYLYITIKFPIDVTYEKLETFRDALELYHKNRPREWMSFLSFRATSIEVSQGFIEYIIVNRHRSSWAEYGALMESKAALMHFCMELSKQLDIWFKSPPLPVEMNLISSAISVGGEMRSSDTFMPGSSGIPIPTDMASSSRTESSAMPDLTNLQALFAPRQSQTR